MAAYGHSWKRRRSAKQNKKTPSTDGHNPPPFLTDDVVQRFREGDERAYGVILGCIERRAKNECSDADFPEDEAERVYVPAGLEITVYINADPEARAKHVWQEINRTVWRRVKRLERHPERSTDASSLKEQQGDIDERGDYDWIKSEAPLPDDLVERKETREQLERLLYHALGQLRNGRARRYHDVLLHEYFICDGFEGALGVETLKNAIAAYHEKLVLILDTKLLPSIKEGDESRCFFERFSFLLKRSKRRGSQATRRLLEEWREHVLSD